MTGWRIGDMLGLARADVDLVAGTAITRWEAEGNKGKPSYHDRSGKMAPRARVERNTPSYHCQ